MTSDLPRSYISIVLALASFAAMGPASVAVAQEVAPPPPAAAPDLAGIADRIDRAVLQAELGQWWGAILVAKDGQPVLLKGYGLENDKLRPIDGDSVFDIASMSKQFTAAALLQLEMDGTLWLDDAVAKFIDRLPGAADKVTLRHLLTHTSGYSDKDTLQTLAFPNREEAVKKFFAATPQADPGERFEYCNAGYVIAAAVVEKASGVKFEKFVIDRVLRPAGMKNSGFFDGTGIDPSRGTARVIGARSGSPRRMRLATDGWGWGLRGAGGIATSLNDLLAWDRALRTDSPLNQRARDEMFGGGNEGYALGWQVALSERGRVASHSGSTRGYTGSMSRGLDDGWFFVVLTHDGGNPDAIMQRIQRIIFGAGPTGGGAIRTNNLTLNEHGLALLEEGVSLAVSREGETVWLSVMSGEAESAKVPMTTKKARDIGRYLAGMSTQKGAAPGDGAMTVMLGTAPYEMDGEGVVPLPDAITIDAQPRYKGTGPAGPMTDERPTLFVRDGAGFMPVIIRMDLPVAAKLGEELRAAAAKEQE